MEKYSPLLSVLSDVFAATFVIGKLDGGAGKGFTVFVLAVALDGGEVLRDGADGEQGIIVANRRKSAMRFIISASSGEQDLVATRASTASPAKRQATPDKEWDRRYRRL